MLTQTQLATKRADRNLASRRKAKGKRTRYGAILQEQAQRRADDRAWIRTAAENLKIAEANHKRQVRDALESRRTKVAMPELTRQGVIGAIKSFFKRRGR